MIRPFNEQIVDAFVYLKSIGVPFTRCKELHHTDTLVSNYNQSVNYYREHKKFEPNGFKYGMKIIELANRHLQDRCRQRPSKKRAA